MVRFAGGAVGTFEASRSMTGPESQHGFEIYGTAGSVRWNLERMNELEVYLAHDEPHTGYTTVFGGDRFAEHGAFVPGRANPIGFEDLVTIEDHHFAAAVAEGRPFDPGFAAAVAYVSVQDALLRSWESGRVGGGRTTCAAREDAVKTVRMTTADAIVRYLIAQRTLIDGIEAPLVPGVFAIFGHGNVTCLGPALHAAGDDLPTWRGQNEQGMALAAIAYAKAMRRRQFMVATSSIGPGALNMVTAAGVAMANRLPVLLLAGDTFQSRLPDPVLQQVEHFDDPSTTANDAFRAVVRYWDRITRPEQVIQSLPQAVATLLDPADCGPAFIALPQDVQAEAFDFPDRLFEPDRPRDRPAAARSPAGGGGRGRAPRGDGAAAGRRRRRALLAGRGGAGGVRRAPRHPGRRDRGRQVQRDVGPPALRRTGRCHRVRGGQPLGRRRRRRGRRRHPAAGLHHRLVERVPQPGDAADRRQRGPVRRRQAPRPAGRRRRP